MKDTANDVSVAAAMTMANGPMNPPATPGIRLIGTYTTTSTIVIVRAAMPISLRPRIAATNGGSRSPRWREMFSMTTMLSSTRMPTARVSASIENRLRFSPSRFINPNVVSTDVGMEIMTISVLRQVWRNSSRISPVRRMASASVR